MVIIQVTANGFKVTVNGIQVIDGGIEISDIRTQPQLTWLMVL